MENSPFLHPGFIVPVALGLIGFIAWLIRLESKVNSTEKEMSRANQSCEDTWRDLEQHRANNAIHFNAEVARQVEARQGERMGRIETDVKEIKEIVKGLAAR